MRPTGIIARISHTRVLSPQGPADVSLCSVLSALWFYIYTEVYGWFRVHFAPSVGLGQGPFLTRLFSYSSSFAEKDHPFSTWPPLGRSGAPAVCLCIRVYTQLFAIDPLPSLSGSHCLHCCTVNLRGRCYHGPGFLYFCQNCFGSSHIFCLST